jgi:hypothetical protein
MTAALDIGEREPYSPRVMILVSRYKDLWTWDVWEAYGLGNSHSDTGHIEADDALAEALVSADLMTERQYHDAGFHPSKEVL